MSPELEEKLYKNYPELFYTRDDPNHKLTLMWGIECEDGWYELIDTLCKELLKDSRIKLENCKTTEEYQKMIETLEPLPLIVQIKEKFGSLRFYVDNINKNQEIIVRTTEQLSLKVCEFCGTMKDVKLYKDGWWKTVCPKHFVMFYGKTNY